MKLKVIIIVFLVVGLSGGGLFFYKYNYVETLLLYDIIGKTDNSFINFGVSLFDFDTGLTRHDIKQLIDHKDYWIGRINEVDAIQNSDQKQQATFQTLADFLDEPVMKKLKSKLKALSPDGTLELKKTIIQN